MLQQYPELVPILETYAAEPEFTHANAASVVLECTRLNIKNKNGRPFQAIHIMRAMAGLVAELAAEAATPGMGVDAVEDRANLADAEGLT